MAKNDVSALSLQTEAEGRLLNVLLQQNKHLPDTGSICASSLLDAGTALPIGVAHLCNTRPMPGWSSLFGACLILQRCLYSAPSNRPSAACRSA